MTIIVLDVWLGPIVEERLSLFLGRRGRYGELSLFLGHGERLSLFLGTAAQLRTAAGPAVASGWGECFGR